MLIYAGFCRVVSCHALCSELTLIANNINILLHKDLAKQYIKASEPSNMYRLLLQG